MKNQRKLYQTPAALEEARARLRAKLDGLEATLSERSKPLKVHVGEALAARKIKVDELLVEWDPSGDGQVRRMELRFLPSLGP